MKSLLILPVATADCERVFSQANLVRNKMRNKLKQPMIEALLGSKINAKGECTSFEPSREMLQLAPKATHAGDKDVEDLFIAPNDIEWSGDEEDYEEEY